MNGKDFGLSKKTNLAIAGIGGITMARDTLYAVIAILVIVLAGQIYQFCLDKRKTSNGKSC